MSKIIIGLMVAVVGSVVTSLGLSDSCSSEIMAKLTPVLGMLPGIAFAWWARVNKGDINVFGNKKD